MHPYVERMKEELCKNPPCYGYTEANGLLEMLYMWYVEWNPVNTDRIRADYLTLESMMCGCTNNYMDEVMDIVSRLCSDYEQAAFLEGVRVGIRLALEL